ncbi:hypothetical protein, conserved [Plasmodium gonderi]|uniref:Uncharacterized protein n=1 Tax=Plasmodium gonderi TaxID=77519 RepID=A0A1Y1JQV8_PLAGO|nr:hypothetical protein, conserved [Plasmodium gonderi]GAW82434.1 hypothetical protein, conserved [Plasmodium gonderi]
MDNVQINEDLDSFGSIDSLNEELDNFKDHNNTYSKYSVLYNKEDNELRELNRFENMFKEANICFTYFENIQNNLKKVNDLDKNRKEKFLESSKMTIEIADEIRKLKKEKYTIKKKEKIYDKILREYSLSPLCYNNLTDIKVSLNISFFEHLKQFEYTKENIIKLLNENSSDKISKFYSKHYNKILNKVCKKMCLYVIRENSKYYKRTNKIMNLLLCTISEEREKRRIIIKNCVENFSPLTKLCYKIIIENMEYFNISLSNFLHFRIKLLKKNYNDLIVRHYKAMIKNKLLGEFHTTDASIHIFKIFFSTIYYLIALEDYFFKILLLFNFYYTNLTVPYISAHVENMHNNLYSIVDSLYIAYYNFLETNLNTYPKSYETCYELFHIVDIFIFKLKQFQNNYETVQDVKDIIRKYSSSTVRGNSDLDNNQHGIGKLQNESTLLENSFLENYQIHLGNEEKRRSNILCDLSSNILNGIQKNNPTTNHTNKTNEEKISNKVAVNNLDTEQDENIPNVENMENREMLLDNLVNQETHDKMGNIISRALSMNNSTIHEKGDVIMGDAEFVHRSSKSELEKRIGENCRIVEKYNCKLLNYTQKIQKKIENEFIAAWQQEVVTFYLNKITKEGESNNFDNTLALIKKIFSALNNVYSIYKKSALFGSINKEQNFQNVLDITINPLINNSLKNKNHNLESDYISIINIFVFIQENVAKYEDSSKYCDLLGIIIQEQIEKVLKLENANIIAYLKLDKIKQQKENNINEIKAILEKFYKFAFSEKINNFPIVSKIQSNDIKKDMQLSILNNVHKEYVHVYEMYSSKVHMTYYPDQIKDVLLKKSQVL